MHMSARILVVEDEEALTTLLRYNLDAEGYDVETVGRGDDADTRLKERVPDLIVLDWMLPGLSGIELCRRLRARPETRQLPIIMLTARGEESERVRGLATGADDYIVKPFSVPELLARVKGLLRRASPERLATLLSYGDIELDREKRRVARSGRPIDLGPTEYRLLEFFLEHPGRVFSREQLLDSVWGRDIYIDERTVDVHIGRLRKLLNPGRAAFPGCCAAPSARSRASSTRYGLRRGALPIRGPCNLNASGPALRSSAKSAAPRPGHA
jgi:two-component system phosphate regulon response regulator PhoB